jgi:hypothetical protein
MPYAEPVPYLCAHSDRLTLLLSGIDDFASLHAGALSRISPVLLSKISPQN